MGHAATADPYSVREYRDTLDDGVSVKIRVDYESLKAHTCCLVLPRAALRRREFRVPRALGHLLGCVDVKLGLNE